MAGEILMSSKNKSRLTPHRLQRGVGMIEVMVAVLVMAIGLLGIAAMQATSLRRSQSALERSQAVVSTYAILDSMRANVAVARIGGYDLNLTCNPPDAGGLVANEQRAWILSLKRDLGPNACGRITCAVNACTIGVRWDDSRGSGTTEVSDESQHTLETRTRL
jgi:type IV pilus assembly protein PilV